GVTQPGVGSAGSEGLEDAPELRVAFALHGQRLDGALVAARGRLRLDLEDPPHPVKLRAVPLERAKRDADAGADDERMQPLQRAVWPQFAVEQEQQSFARLRTRRHRASLHEMPRR